MLKPGAKAGTKDTLSRTMDAETYYARHPEITDRAAHEAAINKASNAAQTSYDWWRQNPQEAQDWINSAYPDLAGDPLPTFSTPPSQQAAAAITPPAATPPPMPGQANPILGNMTRQLSPTTMTALNNSASAAKIKPLQYGVFNRQLFGRAF